ncbi:prolyl oligopeptidase family serine peptidase [Granulicella sibirica]|uniref:Prolyl endopeptidase n=1 Tax=Granulicella sibirica TaxID=2479048 RepID=A0A4Q0SXI2_9BACT|nr:prolyl oligopeptidase family serine peptidase [Granulicella sibirica]RXH53881.1 Prolyl endopeptidase [Granulicella sibirica]
MPVSKLSMPGVEEVLHGVTVSDPYRWLEDRRLPETEAWILKQQKLCTEYFERVPGLDALRERVRSYLDVDTIEQPLRIKDRYFYLRHEKGEEQKSICVRYGRTGEERRLIDPSKYDPFASVRIHRVSQDGKMLAYELRHGGEDRCSIHILDIETTTILPDQLESGYPRGFAFTPTNDGFYYCHDTGEGRNHSIRLHRFGEATAEEVLLEVPRSPGSRLVLVADESRLGAIWIHQHANTEKLIDFTISSATHTLAWRTVFSGKPHPFHPLLCSGRIFVSTQNQYGNTRVIELAEDGRELRELIPARSLPLRQFAIAHTRIYAGYVDDGIEEVFAWDFRGQFLGRLNLPNDGTIQIYETPYQDADDFFYTYESFSRPPEIFEYSALTDSSTVWHPSTTLTERVSYHIGRVSYLSRDETEIPLTLVASDGVSLHGPAPVIMTSYGGFGISVTPHFSILATIMMEFGAIFALPHIRGGSEFGVQWHDSARARNRQKAFDDFLAAAEFLCDRDITTPGRLAIFGGSNSGLLVGAALTQRPDLFGAVLCIAPLLDMVRYESFNGAARWRREYGTVQDADDFHALYAYSPYHRVQEDVDYPPVMFVSGDKDDRCNPAHVRKMAARLQYRDAQRSAVIVDYGEERGHTPVLPLSVRIDALVRRMAFLAKQLNITLLKRETA